MSNLYLKISAFFLHTLLHHSSGLEKTLVSRVHMTARGFIGGWLRVNVYMGGGGWLV